MTGSSKQTHLCARIHNVDRYKKDVKLDVNLARNACYNYSYWKNRKNTTFIFVIEF